MYARLATLIRKMTSAGRVFLQIVCVAVIATLFILFNLDNTDCLAN